jgi:hypothetical protein
MRTRHSNMLAMAHSLRTRSEPKLVSPQSRACLQLKARSLIVE